MLYNSILPFVKKIFIKHSHLGLTSSLKYKHIKKKLSKRFYKTFSLYCFNIKEHNVKNCSNL